MPGPGAATVPQLISKTAEEYLEEFSARFDGAYVAAEADPWAERLGLTITSRFKQRIPIPVDAPSIRRAIGDPLFRRLYVGELQFEPAKYEDGVEELADVLEAPDFVGWLQAPENMAREFRRYSNKLVATMLEANPYLDLYTIRKPGGITASTINLFSASHKVNLVDSSFNTQSNLIAQGTHLTFDETLLDAVTRHFAEYKAANGEPMALQLTDVLVPTGRATAARKFFGRDTVIEEGSAGVIRAPNVFQNAANVNVAHELTDADYVYFLASAVPAWVLQTGGPPEQFIFDRNSDAFKKDGYLKLGYRQVKGTAGLVPHGILRVDLKSEAR